MSDLKADLIKLFVETGSFKHDREGKFKLSSGVKSEFYVDCKALMSSPQARNLVAQLAFEKVRNLNFDCIGGLEIGAIAISTAISDFAYRETLGSCSRPTFVVRKERKEHGLGNKIEGLARGRALIVDDVLTSGGSILKAVDAAREAGLTVEYALVIVDREEQEGRTRVEKEGLKLISLLTIKDFHPIKNMTPAFAS
jgi:orotate phosphoribosyltransferase